MNYNFPVALEPIYTKAGNQVPRIQAVVRQDTHEPLSAVSHKYNLIPHEVVVSEAQKLVEAFGPREEKFHLSGNGSRLIYQNTYKSPDQTLRLRLGDIVGLRVFVENSYNTTRAVSVRIGFLVLSCLNGMVTAKDVFNYTCRHVGKKELEFPKPESLYPAFQHEVSNINQLGETPIKRADVPYLVATAQENGLVSIVGAEEVEETVLAYNEPTAWDMMQAFTNFTTHSTGMSEIGKINRLDRIGSWFNHVFRDGGYGDVIEKARQSELAILEGVQQ